MTRSRSILSVLLSALLTLGVSGATAAAEPDERTLERYASDTWRSFEKLVEPSTGLPADNIDGKLRPSSRSAYTSPTNIGMYLWATLSARDIGLISAKEATKRMDRTIRSIERLERHEPSGQFWNWYSPKTGAVLTTWPENGNPVYPFASSVDNGWLASALIMVANADPALSGRAWALAESMNFGCYYDPNAKPDVGLIRGGFWLEGATPPGSDGFPRGDYCAMGEDVVYTGHHYGAFNTEPRIASYIGIAMGDIPAKHYYGGWRTFPDTCDWNWPETKPIGEWREYMGVDVFEGAYPVRRSARRPDLGRQHVRGADGPAGGARRGVGTDELGGDPPAVRRVAGRVRPRRSRLRLLGLLALERPGRRLPRVRRRRTSAWSRTVTPQTWSR